MAAKLSSAAVILLLRLVAAQQAGNYTAEVHPVFTTSKCTTAGGCVSQNTSVVLDSNYRWIHTVGGYTSCETSTGSLNTTLCPDAATCGANCALEGANYTAAGISTSASGSSITLNMFEGTSAVSPRVYLLASGGEDYEDLQLLGQEIAFTVDVSKLPCGMNGALYLSEMNMTGGRNANNPAGATYGTGYCDAQCGTANFIDGQANTAGDGACCNEMDLWEANSAANAFTPHACNITGTYACSGTECGASGVCDKDGCGFNAYAQGNTTFYGSGLVVDTTKPFTVVTQFVTADNTTTGTLSQIRRLYVQGGKIIANAESTSSDTNAITDAFCSGDYFETQGGLKAMGGALGRGMVLVLSIWDDAGQDMNWLDSGSSGPCNSTVGAPATIQADYPNTAVTWSDVRWGDIGSTYSTSSS